MLSNKKDNSNINRKAGLGEILKLKFQSTIKSLI